MAAFGGARGDAQPISCLPRAERPPEGLGSGPVRTCCVVCLAYLRHLARLSEQLGLRQRGMSLGITSHHIISLCPQLKK